MKKCSNCGAVLRPQAKFCTECGASVGAIGQRRANYCTNPKCMYHTVELGPKDRYCPECGELTDIGKKIEDLI